MVDTSLQSGKTTVKTCEIYFAYEDKDGKRVIKVKELEVTVNLWYLPSSAAENPDKLQTGKDKFLFFSEKKLVKIN